jgi:small subunit ribosomal protein S17
MADAKDSGTESAEPSVNEGDAVEETQPETPAEETPVAEQPESAAPEAAAEPEEPAAEEAPAAEPAAEEPAAAAEKPAAAAEEPAAAEEAAPPAVSGPKQKRRRMPRSERHKHSKPAREKPAERRSITRTPKPDTTPAVRQERRGIVVSDKGEKTIIVKVDVTKLHPKYKKVVRRTRKFHAHDEQNAAGIGDVVRIIESRPLSKLKNWRLAEIVEKAR